MQGSPSSSTHLNHGWIGMLTWFFYNGIACSNLYMPKQSNSKAKFKIDFNSTACRQPNRPMSTRGSVLHIRSQCSWSKSNLFGDSYLIVSSCPGANPQRSLMSAINWWYCIPWSMYVMNTYITCDCNGSHVNGSSTWPLYAVLTLISGMSLSLRRWCERWISSWLGE